MTKSNWNADQIPDQKGRIAIITGATSGLGKEAARTLGIKNATVIMAVRNLQKGEGVVSEITAQHPGADVQVRELDLGSLSSVRSFAHSFQKDFNRLDLLVNNAGVMMCPFSTTEDGFEIQMGTNHLGHFALTGHLMPLLKRTPGSRVIATSSTGHKMGNIDFGDINWEKRKYNTRKAYADSKLANLYFTYELVRKLESEGSNPMAVAAHPGWTSTELQRHSGLFMFLNRFFGQGAETGTLPTLRAAIDTEAIPGDYYGPSGFMEMNGHPVKVKSNKLSHHLENAKKLWEMSEALTGVKY
jgi:NAD(P)-dependent dehydrogenase (short-subunit alcohol dehydrogenase family)